jgi:integrase
MTVVPIQKQDTSNVIELTLINGGLGVKPEVRYNKDGSIDKRHSNKVAGISSEVYPLTNEEEIKSMINVFNKHIDEATNNNQRQIACRNKMLFLIGINVGLRASDLITLKWNFFFNSDEEFKDCYSLQPKKTKKTKKFVKLYFNQAVKKAVADYIEEYPIQDMDEYLFKSRKGDGAISERGLWRIIVDTAAEAGINKNVGSHTLRKTFGRFVFHNAADKNKALVILQTIFNHSSPAVTSKYIGLTDDEVSDVFNELNLGIDFI